MICIKRNVYTYLRSQGGLTRIALFQKVPTEENFKTIQTTTFFKKLMSSRVRKKYRDMDKYE